MTFIANLKISTPTETMVQSIESREFIRKTALLLLLSAEKTKKKLYKLDFEISDENGIVCSDEVVEVECTFVEKDEVKKFEEPENVENLKALYYFMRLNIMLNIELVQICYSSVHCNFCF